MNETVLLIGTKIILSLGWVAFLTLFFRIKKQTLIDAGNYTEDGKTPYELRAPGYNPRKRCTAWILYSSIGVVCLWAS